MSLRGRVAGRAAGHAGRAGLPRAGLEPCPIHTLWRLDTAIPRGANQQIHAAGRCASQDVRRHRLPITNADQAGRRTAVVRSEDRIETVEPLLTLL